MTILHSTRPYLIPAGFIASFLLALLPYSPEVIDGILVVVNDVTAYCLEMDARDFGYSGLYFFACFFGLTLFSSSVTAKEDHADLQTIWIYQMTLGVIVSATGFWVAALQGVPLIDGLTPIRQETIFGCLLGYFMVAALAWQHIFDKVSPLRRAYNAIGIFAVFMLIAIVFMACFAEIMS